ncbi:hypothetical protein TNCV_4659811 [Trichonephila clavipes]|uniref:Uncharacterized protein n=1 Tax=Trichonephila clavipes TaxID=2585209 RepID=A0A8X6SCB1_TRICX|nr:hypothetical protein TNCV_4659811 [Trichonephila clavipes]
MIFSEVQTQDKTLVTSSLPPYIGQFQSQQHQKKSPGLSCAASSLQATQTKLEKKRLGFSETSQLIGMEIGYNNGLIRLNFTSVISFPF